MNKHLRISLIGLATLALLLAVALPGLAKTADTYSCSILSLIVNRGGAYEENFSICGELEAYWEDGVLYNVCRGIIPWGEPIDRGTWRYATFDETCAYFGDRVSCSKTLLSITKDQWGVEGKIFDPITGEMINSVDDAWYTAHKYSGKFVLYKEYRP